MRILLTGGAGYIGSHAAVELLGRGHHVAIVDDLSNGSVESVRRVEEISGRRVTFHLADLANVEMTRRIFGAGRFDAVVHFAGLKAVGESVTDPLRYYRTNLGSTLVLLEVMGEFGVKKLVFSSSATVYGESSSTAVDESSQVGVALANPYGRTKAMIEQILNDASVADPELSIAVLRYFNPIGAHESGRIGENPLQTPNNLLPFVGQVAAGLRDRVLVFGDTYETPDGTGVRDYVHVVDLAGGHVAALEQVRSGLEAFNLGTGRGSSVLEVISTYARVAERHIPYEIVAPRDGDIAFSCADATKAARVLGWVARRSLEDACRDAWRWQSANPRGF